MNLLLLNGSLRKGGYHDILLQHAREILASHDVHGFALETIPYYDPFLDTLPRPAAAQAFIDRVTEADAILFASPEFNHSVTGVLKNAIDWASRPAFQSPFRYKPVTMISASNSANGGVLGQQHLKQILDAMLCDIYPATALCVAQANEKFSDGRMIEEKSLKRLERHLSGFADWGAKRKTFA